MRLALASLLLATAVGLGSAAYAADPPKPAAQAGATADHAAMGHGAMGHDAKGHGAGRHGMMGHGMMDMGAMACMNLSDERLAALKSDLKITDAQSSQWNAFAEAMKANAATMRSGMGHGGDHDHDHGAQPGHGMMMGGSLPERLEHHEAMMTAHLEALKKTRAAVSPLYDALSPDQKAKADRLLCGGAGGHMAGHGDHHHDGKPAAGHDEHSHHPQ